mgnify:CR=1 FL=1
MILVDTNVLPRIAQPGHSHRQPALDAIPSLRVATRVADANNDKKELGVFSRN